MPDEHREKSTAKKLDGGPSPAEASTWEWVSANVFHPAANTGLIEPYNAVANIVNLAGRTVAAGDLIEKKELYAVPQAEFLSGTWLVQGLSSGLAMVVPYGLAGKLAGGSMRNIGRALEAEGAAARFLRSEQAAQIVGAALYDGSRQTRPGETHMGNALGGAAGFLIFEKGNAASRALSAPEKLPVRILTGFAGATTQHTVAHFWSSGHVPSYEELAQAGVSGAVMNLALPATQKGLGLALNQASMRLGRGVDLDRYLETGFAGGNPAERSRQLMMLAESSPWVRVQDGAPESRYLHAKQRVELARGDATPGRLGHELDHHVQARVGAQNLLFDRALERLHDQSQPLARRLESAWQLFRQARLDNELSARISEGVIDREVGRAKTLPEVNRLASEIPGSQVRPGLTYESLWRHEFARFSATGGKERPGADHAARRPVEPYLWERRHNNWGEIGRADKLAALAQLKEAPEAMQGRIVMKALYDGDQQVRVEAAMSLSSMSASRVVDCFSAALRSSDYFVRLAALSQFESLPRGDRLAVWNQAQSHKAVLVMPESEKVDKQGRPLRYSGGWDRPRTPEWASEALQKAAEKTPGELLVAAIATLPQSQRAATWMRALEDGRLSEQAAMSIGLVPASHRGQAWHAAWNRHKMGSTWRYTSLSDAIVNQIKSLEFAEERIAAYDTVIKSKSAVGGEALTEALKSLPEEVRLESWRQAFESIKPRAVEPQPDRYGLGYGYSRLRSYDYDRPSQRGVARAIEALPEGQRTAAWLDVAELFAKEQGDDLVRVIEHLPAADRLAAFEIAFERMPTEHMQYRLHAAGPEQLPELIKLVLSTPDAAARHKMLEEYPIWTARDLPPEKVKAVAETTFRNAFAAAKPEDYAALRKLWAELPEPYDENNPSPVQPTPIKEHLSAALPAEGLARLVLNPQDWHLADELARTHPQAVRTLVRKLEWIGDESQSRALAPVVAEWLASGSLTSTVRRALATFETPKDEYESRNLAPDFVDAVSAGASAADKASALAALSEFALSPASRELKGVTGLSMSLAAQIGRSAPESLKERFIAPLENALQDQAADYNWRLSAGRELAALARSGELGDVLIKLPNLRMPPQAVLSEAEQARVRLEVEQGLRDSSKLGKMLGDGTLGRLFPSVFGNADEGGIVGRPQHGGHEYELHVHTLHVLKRVREHPEFARLSEKDQVNVMWAALLHDVGKQAGKADPDHEWVSGNLSWGVLRTLGYPPQRVQRIMNLVSRHGEMSFDPAGPTSKRLSDEAYLDSLAVFYRHPSVIKQLAILNEADIKSINRASDLWQPHVEAELAEISRIVGMRAAKLNQAAVPLLTSRLPERFGLYPLRGDYALLGHASPHMETSFLEQMSLIESPEYSVSASLITPRHRRLYYNDASVIALVAGPTEHISQAFRSNLGTGRAVDWKGHVELTTSWLNRDRGLEFASELDARIRQQGVGTHTGRLGALQELLRRLSQHDTLDELVAERGADSPYHKAQQEVFQALTTDKDGRALKEHNEIKLNNPTVVGLGIIRRGKPVFLEQFHGEQMIAHLLNGEAQPKWLQFGEKAPDGHVAIAASVWKAAMRRRLPLVVLDP